jgi:hypothetical protein
MAQTEIFNCGNLNAGGICRAIAGQWIRKSKYAGGQGVTDVADLGTGAYLKLIWDAADDNDAINKNNLLGDPVDKPFRYQPKGVGNINASIVARQLTLKWSRFFIFAIRGVGGHAMATRLSAGNPNHIQFLDPNFACWEFGTSNELYLYLIQHIKNYYADLLNKEIEVYAYNDK